MSNRNFSLWKPQVHVFIPYAIREGRLESPEYDTASYRAEVKSWFERLELDWRWVPIAQSTLDRAMEEVQNPRGAADLVVFNLCDGDELHGFPGLSVPRKLEAAGVGFTGASAAFYEATTSKLRMKNLFMKHGVATPPFVAIRELPEDLARLTAELGYPAIVKPDISAASVGISLRSVVHDAESASAQVCRLHQEEKREWGAASMVFAERFVDGPEFTVFLVADREQLEGVRVFPAVERNFHSALPAAERFLSRDRYWNEFKEESRLPEGEPFVRHSKTASTMQEKLAKTAIRAYHAVGGTGYARVDIRMDQQTSELYVLEINSNCELSQDEETSIGAILRLSGSSLVEVVSLILKDAFDRFR
ncbi:MAG: ATP-grasp domain-containing protein [Verrucomicrobia bacterium]|nr:ATP-grasp domain-containing protein [Verrucomicrobiota bacterium]